MPGSRGSESSRPRFLLRPRPDSNLRARALKQANGIRVRIERRQDESHVRVLWGGGGLCGYDRGSGRYRYIVREFRAGLNRISERRHTKLPSYYCSCTNDPNIVNVCNSLIAASAGHCTMICMSVTAADSVGMSD